jgi:hypothetical protein
MNSAHIHRFFRVAQFLVLAAVLFAPTLGFAHCDGLDGPVVKAAQQAIQQRNVDLVLIWVQPKDETEVRRAFERTLQVRKLSNEARDFADSYFFETVVRLHRAGEGAPYTGLKPAGRDLGPAIPAADKALQEQSVEALVKLLTSESEKGIREEFKRVLARKDFRKDDVQAGREYVREYVRFIHYVERLHSAVSSPVHGHAEEAEEH